MYATDSASTLRTKAIRQAADAFVFASLPRLGSELRTYLRWRWRRGPRG